MKGKAFQLEWEPVCQWQTHAPNVNNTTVWSMTGSASNDSFQCRPDWPCRWDIIIKGPQTQLWNWAPHNRDWAENFQGSNRKSSSFLNNSDNLSATGIVSKLLRTIKIKMRRKYFAFILTSVNGIARNRRGEGEWREEEERKEGMMRR